MHLGVRVTLLREGTIGRSAVRIFNDATDWVFADRHLGGTLRIMKQKDAGATASPGYAELTIIAEFPANGIESVEFANKETA